MKEAKSKICSRTLHLSINNYLLFNCRSNLEQLIWDVILVMLLFCSNYLGTVGFILSLCLYFAAIIIMEDFITPKINAKKIASVMVKDDYLLFPEEKTIGKPKYSQMYRFSTRDPRHLVLPSKEANGYVAAKRLKHENVYFTILGCALSIAVFLISSVRKAPFLILLVLLFVFIPLKHFLIFIVPRKWWSLKKRNITSNTVCK